MKLDLHVHSKYSKDSLNKPETIIKMAKKRGLNGVAVTDHGTIKGGMVTKKMNHDKDFEVIVGSEIKTEYGDIIGLFLQEEIVSRIFIEVAEEIKDQDGLVILAHPYRKGITFPEKLLERIDLIEGLNARSKKGLNVMALELVKKHKKPITAGSDAHLPFEIGKCRTLIEPNIKNNLIRGNTSVEGTESNYYFVHGLSFSTEIVKKVF
ncbi:MAG: PHP domain-containing protein [Methanomethylovorans sp.]|uniref:PHP domain-containing protein n=1 Tax=Methanomethylovorans sp. TaxID=2758717 RepID=UPI003530E38B